MRLAPLLLLLPLLVAALPAQAQQAEVKEAARSVNCAAGKLEVVKQVTGRVGEIRYKVTCTGQKDVWVLIQCKDRTCTVMR